MKDLSSRLHSENLISKPNKVFSEYNTLTVPRVKGECPGEKIVNVSICYSYLRSKMIALNRVSRKCSSNRYRLCLQVQYKYVGGITIGALFSQ